jgi:hypothetical protein
MAITGITIGLFGTLLPSWLFASRVRGIDFNSPLTYALVAILQLAISTPPRRFPGARPRTPIRLPPANRLRLLHCRTGGRRRDEGVRHVPWCALSSLSPIDTDLGYGSNHRCGIQ